MTKSNRPAGPTEQAKVSTKHAKEIYAAFRYWPDGIECFSSLVEFMDGDRDNDLLQSMKKIDQKNFPEKYVTGKEKKPMVCDGCGKWPFGLSDPVSECSCCGAILCRQCFEKEKCPVC